MLIIELSRETQAIETSLLEELFSKSTGSAAGVSSMKYLGGPLTLWGDVSGGPLRQFVFERC